MDHKSGRVTDTLRRSDWLPLLFLLGIWTIIIVGVNPRGEFMVNDDWSFVKSLEAFRVTGKIIATGWGFSRAPGGPFLLVHLFWGQFFTNLFGYSWTTLRIAVLVLAVLGTLGIFFLLRTLGTASWLAFLGALAATLNPLYLAQSFTYMTDITFAALAIFALWALTQGFARASLTLTGCGLVLVLGSILTRQIGIVMVPALLAAWWLHRRDNSRPSTILLLCVAIVVIPWVAAELLIFRAGSTPIILNQAVQEIYRLPLQKGFYDYSIYMSSGALFTLIYVGFFVSPLLVLRIPALWAEPLVKKGFWGVTAAFLILAALVGAGLVDPPVYIPGNIIFDFGIGPILLKDTYILGLTRTVTLPLPAYLLLVYWAVLSAGMLVRLVVDYLQKIWTTISGPGAVAGNFGASLSLFAALPYSIIIILSGFRDRYLIPLIIFVAIWLILAPASSRGGGATPPPRRQFVASWLLVLAFGVVSSLSLHDFMNMKRALTQAQRYGLQQLHISPCHLDGGLEFNGYHCYQVDFAPRPGLSWWWVQREDYLLALGPLPGYDTRKTFPFYRCLGPEGAIFLLQPQAAARPTSSPGGHGD